MGVVGSQKGNLFSHDSTPGANMMQERTTVTKRTRAYMNLAKPELPQLEGHTAQVVERQVPVKQQAMLPKLKTPPMLLISLFSYFLCLIFGYNAIIFALFLSLDSCSWTFVYAQKTV